MNKSRLISSALALMLALVFMLSAIGQAPVAPDLRGAIEQVDALAAAEFAKDNRGSVTVGIVSGPELVWTKSYGNPETELSAGTLNSLCIHRSRNETQNGGKETNMIRHTMRLGLMAALIWVTLPAVTGFPKAQNNSPHPLEGLYEVSATRTDNGNGFKFLVSLTRDGDKWVGAVREAVIPVTVKEVTVTGENSMTGIATADGGGKDHLVHSQSRREQDHAQRERWRECSHFSRDKKGD